MFFVAGGLVGAAAYMLAYPAIKASGLLEKVLGGKATIGAIEGVKTTPLLDMSGEIVGLVLGVAFIVIAAMLPDRIRESSDPANAGAHRHAG